MESRNYLSKLISKFEKENRDQKEIFKETKLFIQNRLMIIHVIILEKNCLN